MKKLTFTSSERLLKSFTEPVESVVERPLEITNTHRVKGAKRFGNAVAPEGSHANDIAARLEAVLEAWETDVATLRQQLEKAKDWEDTVVKYLEKSSLSCGHNSRYSVVEDGGKTGYCTLCEATRLKQIINEALGFYQVTHIHCILKEAIK